MSINIGNWLLALKAKAQWDRENFFLMTFDQYKGIPVFTVTPTNGWNLHDCWVTITIDEDGNPQIYTTEKMRESPHWAVLAEHEIGHFKAGHLGKLARLTKIGQLIRQIKRAMLFASVLKMEKEADAYAVKMCGVDKVIEMLEFLADDIGQGMLYGEKLSPVREIRQRISHIQAVDWDENWI